MLLYAATLPLLLLELAELSSLKGLLHTFDYIGGYGDYIVYKMPPILALFYGECNRRR